MSCFGHFEICAQGLQKLLHMSSVAQRYGELWHFLHSSHTGENMQKIFGLVNGTPPLKQSVPRNKT